jgi:hypothetical protein
MQRQAKPSQVSAPQSHRAQRMQIYNRVIPQVQTLRYEPPLAYAHFDPEKAAIFIELTKDVASCRWQARYLPLAVPSRFLL